MKSACKIMCLCMRLKQGFNILYTKSSQIIVYTQCHIKYINRGLRYESAWIIIFLSFCLNFVVSSAPLNELRAYCGSSSISFQFCKTEDIIRTNDPWNQLLFGPMTLAWDYITRISSPSDQWLVGPIAFRNIPTEGEFLLKWSRSWSLVFKKDDRINKNIDH